MWLIAGGMILSALIVTAIVLAVVLSIEDDSTTGSIVLKQVPLIDGHNDLAYNLRVMLNNQINNFSFHCNLTDNPQWNCSCCQTDLVRLRAGQVGAQFWVAYVPCKAQYKDAVEQTLEQIDVIKRLIEKYYDDLELVTSAQGIMAAFNNGKIGSLIGVEGGHSIDSRLAILRQMYDLGARYLTLTHTCNTPWADASPVDNETDPLTAESNGLSHFGKRVVLEMNRLGMMVDLSHVSHDTMLDALEVSKAPVIFSHSSAYALCNHHRNVRDEVIKKIIIQKENSYMTLLHNIFIFGGKEMSWLRAAFSSSCLHFDLIDGNHVPSVAMESDSRSCLCGLK